MLSNCARLGARHFHRSCADCGRSEAAPRPAGEAKGGEGSRPPCSASVSYTHLTLPTICSV
eukprot:8603284-Alexandrium_andersonii.AAC.1